MKSVVLFLIKMRIWNKKSYHSVLWKILSVLIASLLVSMSAFAFFFYRTMRSSALRQYEQQTETAIRVSAENINYYLSNCIAAVKSIYVDNDMLTALSRDGGMNALDEKDVFDYLSSIYYASSTAKQIYLAAPRQNMSYLYITSNLQTSVTQLKLTAEELPAFTSYRDIYIQPTHIMTSYGHVVGFSKVESVQDFVFTIWIPIYNLPQASSEVACLGIDMPISFIMENCQFAYNEEEAVYVIDRNGLIIAASKREDIQKNIDDVYDFSINQSGSDYDSYINDGQMVIQGRMRSDNFDWMIVKTVPVTNIYDTSWTQAMMLLVFLLIGFSVVVVFNVFQIYRFMFPLKRLTEYMREMVRFRSWQQEVYLSDYVVYRENDEIGALVDMFETMVCSMRDFTIRQYELELATTHAKLNMLQAQINPHFIYNSIQCFATNALRNQDLHQYQLLSNFGQMLHYAMALEPSSVPLQQEIEYVQRYLTLQKMRFGNSGEDELLVEPEAMTIRIPKMTIQPLVENAVTHGNLYRNAGSILRINAAVQDNRLHVEVADNGVAISGDIVHRIKQRLYDIDSHVFAGEEGEGEPYRAASMEEECIWQGAFIGIENVYTRLLLSFGKCDFEIYPNEMGGTTTAFRIPVSALPRSENIFEHIAGKKHDGFDC